MSWTIVVPLKAAGTRKSRLAPVLDAVAREALALAMFDHVAGIAHAVPGARAIVLSPSRPPGWNGGWQADGGPLNAALEAMRPARADGGFAVVNADLPLLTAADLDALLGAAMRHGIALAPDRHGTGTNAVALAPGHAVAFAFGAGSRAAFEAASTIPPAIVQRPGLALDVDVPADLALARAQGA